MPTTINLRKILDRKQWEFCTPVPTASAAGAFISSSRLFRQIQFYIVNATTAFVYLPEEDGWEELPSPGLGGTFAAGACGTTTPMGPSGTATAGTTNTLTTNLTLARDLRGFTIRITGGASAGDERVIASNTVGANSVITVTVPFTTPVTATSTYQLITTRWYVWNAHTVAPVANQFKYYDYALNTWTATANLPAVGAAWGTDGRLISTPSYLNGVDMTYTSGTSTGTNTSTTLNNTGKAWTSNQFANAFQVRITGGTGAGQTRTISSNTPTALTVPTWTTTPDATSTYVIESSDDYLYLIGNNAVTMYRFQISTGTWTTLAPTVARSVAPGLALSGHLIWGVQDADWKNENSIKNGRRIYSFRGGASAAIDYYDIPSNAWSNTVTYAPAATTFTTGSKYTIVNGRDIYIQKEATNRWYKFDVTKSQLDPIGQFLYVQGAAVLGDTCFDVTYTDGATNLTWIHMVLNTSTAHLRMLLI